MTAPAPTPDTGEETLAADAPTGDHAVSLFLLVVTYTRPLAQIEVLLPEHRRWLDENYADGTFLASGPRVPRDGGIILARGRSRAALEALTQTDPFARASVARYELLEFRPNRGLFATSLLAGVPGGDTHLPPPTARS
jgi:uncharacterized protein YciI